MTVVELIKELGKLPQDMQVQFRVSKWHDCGDTVVEIHDIDYVSIYNNIVTLE